MLVLLHFIEAARTPLLNISVKEIYSFLMFLFFNNDAESIFIEIAFTS